MSGWVGRAWQSLGAYLEGMGSLACGLPVLPGASAPQDHLCPVVIDAGLSLRAIPREVPDVARSSYSSDSQCPAVSTGLAWLPMVLYETSRVPNSHPNAV